MKPNRPEPSETDITKAIRRVLDYLGVYHWKQWQGPMSQPRGVSDIIGILPKGVAGSDGGRFLAIEVKKSNWIPPGQTAKSYAHYARQKAFLDKVNERGGLGFFARSVDEVIDALGARKRFLF